MVRFRLATGSVLVAPASGSDMDTPVKASARPYGRMVGSLKLFICGVLGRKLIASPKELVKRMLNLLKMCARYLGR